MLFNEFRKWFFRLYNPSEVTQNNRITALEAATTNPKVYRALLSQSGTDAPVATVLENTIGDITFAYGNGSYDVISDAKFTENKTLLFIGTANPDFSDAYPAVIGFMWVSHSNLSIKTAENNGTPKDGVLKFTSIEILVYD